MILLERYMANKFFSKYTSILFIWPTLGPMFISQDSTTKTLAHTAHTHKTSYNCKAFNTFKTIEYNKLYKMEIILRFKPQSVNVT